MCELVVQLFGYDISRISYLNIPNKKRKLKTIDKKKKKRQCFYY